MADYTRRERTQTWVEYVLSLPTNWAEVGKVYAAVTRDLGKDAYDDVVTVLSDGEELIFRYEKENLTDDR